MVEKKELASKMFDCTLVLNWKNGSVRVLKRSAKKMAPYEVPVKVKIKLFIPEIPDITVKGEIEIPSVKVQEMVLEEI
jgi:hypothetical protein